MTNRIINVANNINSDKNIPVDGNIFPFISPFPDTLVGPFIPYKALTNAEDVEESTIDYIPPTTDIKSRTAVGKIPVNDIVNKTPYGISEPLRYSKQLNKPVISWIELSFDPNNFSGVLANNNEPNYLLITNCLISVSQQPKIVKTDIIGRDGTVKTYLGMDDYRIKIEGYIDNLSGQMIYPIDDVRLLLTNLLIQGQQLGIQVYSPYLAIWGGNSMPNSPSPGGIDFIVITNFEMPQEAGKYSQQKFMIEAISDAFNDVDTISSPYTV